MAFDDLWEKYGEQKSETPELRETGQQFESVLRSEFLLKTICPRKHPVHSRFVHECGIKQVMKPHPTIPSEIFVMCDLKEPPGHFGLHEIGIVYLRRETAELNRYNPAACFRSPVQCEITPLPDCAPVWHADLVFSRIRMMTEPAPRTFRLQRPAILRDIDNLLSTHRKTAQDGRRGIKNSMNPLALFRVEQRKFKMLCPEFRPFP